jgi:hypothetical protein
MLYHLIIKTFMKNIRLTLLASAVLLASSLVTGFAATLVASPSADGTYTSWTPSTGTTHFTLVDESPCNGTTDYVSTTVVGNRDSYSVNVSGISNGSTITAVAITPCASRVSSGSGTGVLNVFYRLNGANSSDAGAYAITGTTPTALATTTFSSLSVVKSSTTTLEIGAVFTSGTKGARLSRMATVITYTPGPTSFSIVSSAGANGVISPNGTTTVPQGNNQTYTITPNTNYKIASLTIDGTSTTATSTYTFTNVQANHTISATFTPITYSIFSSAGTYGSISPVLTNIVNAGANKSYTITASSTNAVADVLVDGISVGATTSYTFINVQANHTISATFTPIVVNDPSNLAATTTSGHIGLTWTDNSDNESYFALERKLTSTSTWALLATTTVNSVSYNDFAVASSTSYDYRVRAIGIFSGSLISSLYSNIVTAISQ